MLPRPICFAWMKRTRRGRPARMSVPTRLLVGLACVTGLLDLLLLTAGNSPVKPRIVSSTYEVVPVVVRTAAGEQPEAGALLTTSFRIEIPSQWIGRRVGVSQVEFYSQTGELLGRARVPRIRPPASWLPDAAAGSAGSTVLIPPLREVVIRFDAVPTTALRVQPGAKIYAEIDGRAGRNAFSARSALAAAAANGS